MQNDTIAKIDNIIDEAYQNIQYLLEKEFPYLEFLVLSSSSLCVYIKGKNGTVYGTDLKVKIKVGQLFSTQWEVLEDLNYKGKSINESTEDCFYCSNCDRVLPKEEFEANVLAGFYCKTCAQIPAIKNMIEESREEGFYD